MDLNAFSRKMQVRSTGVEKNVGLLKGKVAREILKVVAEDTPVDVGIALSNWQVGIGGSRGTPIPAHVPGMKGTTHDENVQETIRTGDAVLTGARAGKDIHIANPIPYIADLNDGYSAQAPAGFVEKAVLQGLQVVRNAKLITE
jgi:hypothetical protein